LARIISLKDAVQEFVRDGDSLALEGFTHLIPFAAGHEIIRQQRRDLTVMRMTPDVVYDQMIGAGCVAKLIFSWGGNPGVGSLHRLRDAVENQWPRPLAIDEHAHAGMAAAYAAGASGLPFAVLRGYLGSDLPKFNSNIKFIDCPFTGERLAAIPANRPDVGIIHAQKADRKGNVLMWGLVGVQKETVLAAKRSIVTVEEVVDRLEAPPNAVVIPHWAVGAVCEVPGGAFPSYAHGYYARANAFYKQWDVVSRDRDSFRAWIQRHVMDTADFAEFRRSIGLRLPEGGRHEEAAASSAADAAAGSRQNAAHRGGHV
jgi:glutaconate CoA-transferase subunit A